MKTKIASRDASLLVSVGLALSLGGYSLFISTDDVDITGTVSGFKGP